MASFHSPSPLFKSVRQVTSMIWAAAGKERIARRAGKDRVEEIKANLIAPITHLHWRQTADRQCKLSGRPKRFRKVKRQSAARPLVRNKHQLRQVGLPHEEAVAFAGGGATFVE